MRVWSSTCTTVAMPPLVFEVTLGGAPCEVVSVIRCGTRVVLLTIVNERENACCAIGGATASFWTLTTTTTTNMISKLFLVG